MADLKIAQAAEILSCHRNTLINYERRGLIKPLRDSNGYRRFTAKQVCQVKSLLKMRVGNK